MHLHLLELLPLIGGALLVFGRYALLSLASKMVSDWLQKRLVKSEAEMVTWLHFRYKVMRQGHRHKTVVACNDGKCADITN